MGRVAKWCLRPEVLILFSFCFFVFSEVVPFCSLELGAARGGTTVSDR